MFGYETRKGKVWSKKFANLFTFTCEMKIIGNWTFTLVSSRVEKKI